MSIVEEFRKALEASFLTKDAEEEIFSSGEKSKLLVAWEKYTRWVGDRLPEKVRRWLRSVAGWLRSVAGEPPVILRSSLIKPAQEMFIRGLLTEHELLHFEANLFSNKVKPETMKRVVTFIKSGDWMESTPAWDKKREELSCGYSRSSYMMSAAAGHAARPRTVTLKGSKAAEQQEQGYGPGGAARWRQGYQERLADVAKQALHLKNPETDLDSSLQIAESLVNNLTDIWRELQHRKDT